MLQALRCSGTLRRKGRKNSLEANISTAKTDVALVVATSFPLLDQQGHHKIKAAHCTGFTDFCSCNSFFYARFDILAAVLMKTRFFVEYYALSTGKDLLTVR
jgi:hypothetical protein